jgi:hypothetical protein
LIYISLFRENISLTSREEPNTGMLFNIHVSLAWMPVKALLAHGCAISAGTSRILGDMEETRLMQQRRVSPERVRRLSLFGCRQHPDTRQVNKIQASDSNFDYQGN